MNSSMVAKWVLIAAWCIAAVAPERFSDRRVPPVHDAKKRLDLGLYLADLSKAVKDRNVARLSRLTDDNITFSFGAEQGKQAFIQNWGLDKDPNQSPLWRELDAVLRLGGVYSVDDGTPRYIAPAMFANWPEDMDSFEFSAITGESVRVRSGPSRSSQQIAQLSHQIVRIEALPDEVEETIDGETYPWHKVQLSDGQRGFVWGKYVRSPLDYRAGFEFKNGAWKLTFFIAGD